MIDQDNYVHDYAEGYYKVYVDGEHALTQRKDGVRTMVVPEKLDKAAKLLEFYLTNNARCHRHPEDGRYCHVCECLIYTN